jgi:hypothetical protein
MSTVKEPTKIEGFSRVKIEDGPTGKLIGDSGWSGPNQITNLGFQKFLCFSLGSSTGSSYVKYAALGTGGAPASDATTLPGEIMSSTQRNAVTFGSVTSTTAQFTVSFMSSESFLTASKNLSNVGLFMSNATNDTLFAGNTYTSSACNTNQNVYVTYQIRFS